MGPLQSDVPHAVHWLRAFSTTIAHRHVADHAVHDIWCYMLRTVSRTRNQLDTELGFVAPTVQRKGKKGSEAAVLLALIWLTVAFN